MCRSHVDLITWWGKFWDVVSVTESWQVTSPFCANVRSKGIHLSAQDSNGYTGEQFLRADIHHVTRSKRMTCRTCLDHPWRYRLVLSTLSDHRPSSLRQATGSSRELETSGIKCLGLWSVHAYSPLGIDRMKVLDVSTSPSKARKMNWLLDTSRSVSHNTSNHTVEPVAPQYVTQKGRGCAFPQFGFLSRTTKTTSISTSVSWCGIQQR